MTHLSLFNLAALMVALAAFFGYLNHRLLKLPPTIRAAMPCAKRQAMRNCGLSAVPARKDAKAKIITPM